jgi:hypothetical protein
MLLVFYSFEFLLLQVSVVAMAVRRKEMSKEKKRKDSKHSHILVQNSLRHAFTKSDHFHACAAPHTRRKYRFAYLFLGRAIKLFMSGHPVWQYGVAGNPIFGIWPPHWTPGAGPMYLGVLDEILKLGLIFFNI